MTVKMIIRIEGVTVSGEFAIVGVIVRLDENRLGEDGRVGAIGPDQVRINRIIIPPAAHQQQMQGEDVVGRKQSDPWVGVRQCSPPAG
jgi:hypothetical protein